MLQRFEVERIVRVLNIFSSVEFSLLILGPTAECQTLKHRQTIRQEIAEVAQHMREVGLASSADAFYLIIEAMADDTRPLNRFLLAPIIGAARYALQAELGTLMFCKIVPPAAVPPAPTPTPEPEAPKHDDDRDHESESDPDEADSAEHGAVRPAVEGGEAGAVQFDSSEAKPPSNP